MRTSGTEVTGRACNRDFSVVLGAIQAGRARGAALLASVRVVEPNQALQRAAGSVSAVSSCVADGTTGHALRSRCHCTSSANVTARALPKLPVPSTRNTCTVARSAKCSSVAHNTRDQSVRRRGVPTMYVVRRRTSSANTSNGLERYDTSKR